MSSAKTAAQRDQARVNEGGVAGFWAAVKLNIYGVGLMALWTTVNTVLLPDRVDPTVPSSLRGSALGLISLIGVGAAAFFQPWAGQVSDRAAIRDRRRPFIAAGTVGICGFVLLFGWAPGFWLLLTAYVFLQLSANVAQVAFQAFIPDLVDEQARGLASGVKNALTVVGAAVGLVLARGTLAVEGSGRLAVAALAVVVALLAYLTYRWVPPIPPLDAGHRAKSLRDLLAPSGLWQTFAATLRDQPVFRAAVIAQLLFMLSVYPVQRYLVYFLEDRFGKGNAASDAAVGGAVAVVVGATVAALAGKVSDDLGRVPVLRISVALVVVGLVGFAVLPNLVLVGIAGVLLAIAVGAFLATNWALLTDHLPAGHGARALGVANIATAGAGALAGLFGPLIDLARHTNVIDAYTIAFGLCALIAAVAFWPLHAIAQQSHENGKR